jgi:hypothetical protein
MNKTYAVASIMVARGLGAATAVALAKKAGPVKASMAGVALTTALGGARSASDELSR